MGSTNFSSSAALFLAGAEGGGDGFAAGAAASVVCALTTAIPVMVARAKMKRIFIMSYRIRFLGLRQYSACLPPALHQLLYRGFLPDTPNQAQVKDYLG